MSEPVAWMSYEDLEEWKEGLIENSIVYKKQYDGTFPLYTTPQTKESYSYMVDALNNTLNLERNHNEKAYKELYDF